MRTGVLVGIVLGVVTATALYQKTEKKSFASKAKKAIEKKLDCIF